MRLARSLFFADALDPQNFRGWNGKLALVDETAFIPKRTLTEGVLPVSVQDRVATLLTTTPGPENCYFMRLLEKVDARGNPKLPIVRFGQPCVDCKQGDTPWKCTHNLQEVCPQIPSEKL